jgi:uncharacterized membrane protein
MRRCARAASALFAVIAFGTASGAAQAAELSDIEALALVQKHCTPCHARNPAHPAFTTPPKNIVLETLGDLRKDAARVLEQAVEDRTMPLGNETDMTDDDRAALGRWLKAMK